MQQFEIGGHLPESVPIQQPNISLDDVSAFEQVESNQELPIPQPQVEEVA